LFLSKNQILIKLYMKTFMEIISFRTILDKGNTIKELKITSFLISINNSNKVNFNKSLYNQIIMDANIINSNIETKS
jgi:hypothetical protein